MAPLPATWVVARDGAGNTGFDSSDANFRIGNPCYANCDESTVAPVLNVGDFTCFLQAFASGDPYANCDGSTLAPTLNVGDFTCFLNRFAAGHPDTFPPRFVKDIEIFWLGVSRLFFKFGSRPEGFPVADPQGLPDYAADSPPLKLVSQAEWNTVHELIQTLNDQLAATRHELLELHQRTLTKQLLALPGRALRFLTKTTTG